MTTPKWATELMAKVLEEEQAAPVTLVWRRSKTHRIWLYRHDDWPRRRTSDGASEQSSGHAHPKERRIVVTAGSSRRDQKLVLLHELAHILTDHHHAACFWDKAWELYRRYGVPIRYAQKREYAYRKEARAAYLRSRR